VTMGELEGKRWRVVNYWRENGRPSYYRVALATGTSPSYARKWILVWQVTHDVASLPRQVAHKAIRQQMAARAVVLVQQKDYSSAERVANKLTTEFSRQVSASTVRRWLKANKLEYSAPVFQPLLSALQRAARVRFANANSNTNWNKIMFTDSKYFLLHPPAKGRLLRCWAPVGQRRVLPAVKNSQQVHVYAGVTPFGVTGLYFVTGTTGQKSAFTNPRTGQPFSGVCQLEYQQHIAPKLIEDGFKIFSKTAYARSWVFQQDGATVHTAKNSVEYIAGKVPGGVLAAWPANSPDLSWIENIWSWMERELRRRPVCHNVEELKRVLVEIWEDLQSNNAHILRNCAASLPKRMRLVIEKDGAHTGY
jgi:hypothetical protein